MQGVQGFLNAFFFAGRRVRADNKTITYF